MHSFSSTCAFVLQNYDLCMKGLKVFVNTDFLMTRLNDAVDEFNKMLAFVPTLRAYAYSLDQWDRLVRYD